MAPKYDHTGVDDTSVIEERIIMPSTIETIDESFYQYINEELNIFSTTNKGWNKVPVIWMSAERSHQIKNNKDLRDANSSLILPAITIERTSMIKDPTKKGIYWAHQPPPHHDNKGGSVVIARRLNQDKTSNFANANAYEKRGQINFPKKNNKVVYQTVTIPMPVYVDITYSLTLRTEYQQQMNEIVTPFITKTGGVNYFVFKKDGHTYEAFIQQDFSQDNNVSNLEAEERKYQTKVDIKVLGYLIGEDKNQDQPKIVVRENAVDYKMPRERVITEDSPELGDKDTFYRG
tara:strand:- start:1668 stop:2537 length:870 start_codon:yes stop_codon:yes gene_type:complete